MDVKMLKSRVVVFFVLMLFTFWFVPSLSGILQVVASLARLLFNILGLIDSVRLIRSGSGLFGGLFAGLFGLFLLITLAVLFV